VIHMLDAKVGGVGRPVARCVPDGHVLVFEKQPVSYRSIERGLPESVQQLLQAGVHRFRAVVGLDDSPRATCLLGLPCAPASVRNNGGRPWGNSRVRRSKIQPPDLAPRPIGLPPVFPT
jgi:hypothetical protein